MRIYRGIGAEPDLDAFGQALLKCRVDASCRSPCLRRDLRRHVPAVLQLLADPPRSGQRGDPDGTARFHQVQRFIVEERSVLDSVDTRPASPLSTVGAMA